jgi:hypothetical protein
VAPQLYEPSKVSYTNDIVTHPTTNGRRASAFDTDLIQQNQTWGGSSARCEPSASVFTFRSSIAGGVPCDSVHDDLAAPASHFLGQPSQRPHDSTPHRSYPMQTFSMEALPAATPSWDADAKYSRSYIAAPSYASFTALHGRDTADSRLGSAMPRPPGDNTNGHWARWTGGGEQSARPAPAPAPAPAGRAAPLLRAHSAPGGSGGGDEGGGGEEEMAAELERYRCAYASLRSENSVLRQRVRAAAAARAPSRRTRAGRAGGRSRGAPHVCPVARADGTGRRLRAARTA